MEAFEATVLKQVGAYQTSLATTAQSTISSILSDLQLIGADNSSSATGTYNWTNINIVDDGSNLPPLTNAQCLVFNQFFVAAQSSLKSQLAAQMAKTLSLPADGISFASGAIVCGPQYPLQTRSDQHALFVVEGLQLTTLYTMFAKGVGYVTYASPSVNHNLQVSEALAPLSIAAVRSALQTSLRRVFLATMQSYYRLSHTCICYICCGLF